MKTFFTSLLSAILGALIVYSAFTLAPPSKTEAPLKGLLRTIPVTSPRRAVGTGGELSAQEIYQRYGAAVVHVKARVTNSYDNIFGLPVPEDQVSSGSGFIVTKDGYVITNAHVVAGADHVTVQFSDKAEEEAKLIGIDQSTDLAVLKVDVSKHEAGVLALGSSKEVSVGQTVYAIGNPLGYDRSMSAGIVSALNRIINAPNGIEIRGVLQTDAAVNRGNSGGPLVSATGVVVGVTSQIASTGEGNIGIAFAIPSDTVKKVFEDIKKDGKTSRPWIGIQGATITEELAKRLGLKVKAGAMVVSIMDNGPAKDAGLRAATREELVGDEYLPSNGDVITKINKVDINSMEALVNEINQYRAGDKVVFTVSRDGKALKFPMRLTERPLDMDEPNLER